MDGYLDQYFSSSSWSDVNVKGNALPPSSLGVLQDDKDNSPVSMISSNHSMECLASHSPPPLAPNAEPGCGVEHGLLFGVSGPEMAGQNCCSNFSKDMFDANFGFGNQGLQFNTAIESSGSVSLGSSKNLPAVANTTPSLSFNEGGHVICSGGESSEFGRSLAGLETLSPVPQLWHPQPYENVSSFPTLIGQTRMQSSCLQGECGNVDDDDGNINRFVEIDKILQPENLSASINAKDKQDMQNSLYSSFPADHQIAKTSMIGLPSLLQSGSPTPNSGSNGIGKPRVRARRGQATDPHSIAERLRREKIAERMKNLQELVPNSNKTDKASMLDEIIEYVKFLQLQVKVLSMSRLGAAGAVVPLITDGQAEGSNGLSLTPLLGQGVDFSLSPDQVVFEQEVVKLMESNMTMAMQYLQSKGLCLMPIALAAAISNGKASSSSSSSPGSASERKKLGFTKSILNHDIVHNTCSSNGLVQSSNCSSSSSSSSNNGSLPGVGTNHANSDGTFMIGKLSSGMMANGCNGTFKKEVNTLCTAK